MSTRFVMVATAVFVLSAATALTRAEEPRPNALPALLEKLHAEVVVIEGPINDVPLFELLQRFSKRHGLSFVINEEQFRAEGIPEIRDKKPSLSATQLRGLTLHQFLLATLDSMGATYIIKGNSIEIVTPTHAAKFTKAPVRQAADGGNRLAVPLVSAVIKEKPLNKAVSQIAERYDLTVIVSPQAGDALSGLVTARLLNVPADQAIELLALQGDLRVIRKGPAYFVTSREQADSLFNERIDQERARIELRQLRNAPPSRPGLQPGPFPLFTQLQPGGGAIEPKTVPPKKP